MTTRSSMTRSGYEMIAAVVRQSKLGNSARKELARSFAAELRHTNTRFDSERFLRACDPGESYSPRSHSTDRDAFI